jgi:RNA-directed DNA polymerase
VLSNLYLNEVDRMLERARKATRYKQYTAVQYARFADDRVPRVRKAERLSSARLLN